MCVTSRVWSTFSHIRKVEHCNQWAALSGISFQTGERRYKRPGKKDKEEIWEAGGGRALIPMGEHGEEVSFPEGE